MDEDMRHSIPIDPGLFEEMRAHFVDKDYLRVPERRLYRVNQDRRMYWSPDVPEGHDGYFLSVTTMLGECVGKSDFLIDWYIQKGKAEAERYVAERTHYGTLMHKIFEEFLVNGEFNLEWCESSAWRYIDKNGLPYSIKKWARDLRWDLVGFAEFVRRHKVRPVAIELVLGSDRLKLAGAVDFVCSMTIEEPGFNGEVYATGPRKGQPKEVKVEREVLALIDFKSSRKAMQEEKALQLEAYRRIFEENFPDLKVERLYNWSPRAWRRDPSSRLTDWSDSKVRKQFPAYVALARHKCKWEPNEVVEVGGTLTLGESVERNVLRASMDSLLMEAAS